MKIKGRWKIKDQAKLFHQLGYLLNKGYTLATALEFLILHMPNEKKQDLQFILLQLKQGVPFFNVFDPLYFSSEGLSFIYFSEKYGELAAGLVNAGKMLEKKQRYKEQTEKIMRYPLFLMFILILLIIMMQNVLLPQFIQLSESMDLPQSNFISTVLFLKSFFPSMLLIVISMISVAFLIYFFYFRRKTLIEQKILLCKFPFIRFIVQKYNTYFFSFHLGNLLENGLSINEALSVFENQNQIGFFQEEAERIRTFLLEGEQLETILKSTTYYDKELATIIIHGQANGILPSELLDYSRLIMEKFEETLKGWLKVLQPAMLLLVGVMVVLMYLAVMLPIYGMLQTL